jgi:hypothetical protein
MIAAWALVLVYGLWVFYLAVMNLQRARNAGTLDVWAYRFGLPVFVVGWLLDFVVNIAVLSFIMLEPPRELLVTSRLKRHIATGTGWRCSMARWVCSNLLDAFDPSGCHCD